MTISTEKTNSRYVLWCIHPNGRPFSKICESDSDLIEVMESYLSSGIFISSFRCFELHSCDMDLYIYELEQLAKYFKEQRKLTP